MSKDLTWPADRMAKFVDLTTRRLRALAEEGVIPKAGRGRYDPFAVNVAYIRYLRDRVQSPELSNDEFFGAKLAKIKSEREMVELEMSIKRRERIPIEDCAATENEVLQAISGTLKANRNKLLSETVINEISENLRNWADRFEAKA